MNVSKTLSKVTFLFFKDHLKYLIILIYALSSATNPCEVNNGGCSHLCLLANIEIKSHTCRCPNGMNTTDDGITCTGTPVTVQPTPRTKSYESKTTTLASIAVTAQVSKSTAKTTQGTTRSNVPVSKPSKKPSSTTSNIPVSKPSSAPNATKSTRTYNTTEGIVEFRKGKN